MSFKKRDNKILLDKGHARHYILFITIHFLKINRLRIENWLWVDSSLFCRCRYLPIEWYNIQRSKSKRSRRPLDYSFDHKAHSVLQIYDVSGKCVQALVDETQNHGSYRINWDVKDGNGNQVSTGLFLYKMTTCRITETKRMTFVK